MRFARNARLSPTTVAATERLQALLIRPAEKARKLSIANFADILKYQLIPLPGWCAVHHPAAVQVQAFQVHLAVEAGVVEAVAVAERAAVGKFIFFLNTNQVC